MYNNFRKTEKGVVHINTLKMHQRLNIPDEKHLVVDGHTVTSNHPLHWHSFFELEIILSGAGKYIVNDVAYDISSNNVFLLSTTDFHYIETDKAIKLINISFDEEVIDEKDLLLLLFSKTEKAYTFTPDEQQRLIKAAELLEHEYQTDGDCQRQLLHYILNSIFRKNPNPYPDAFYDEQYHGIKKAVVYMEMHFKEKITLQTLASQAGYHPAYFSELFKKCTGETYISALNKLRIGYARTLLANGFSVSQSCFLSGFSSLSNFGEIFKKFCQMSPREYSKASRK